MPNLVFLEGPPFLVLLYFGVNDVFGLPVCGRSDVLVEQKNHTADDECKRMHGPGDSVKADPVCLHGNDLVIAGKKSKRNEGCQEDAGGHHVGHDSRQGIEVIGKDLCERGVIAQEHAAPLEEVDDQIQTEECQQDKTERHEEFPGDVTIEDRHAVTFSAFQGGATSGRSRVHWPS